MKPRPDEPAAQRTPTDLASPSIKRIEQIDEGNKLNDLIAPWCKQTPGLTFIDTRDPPSPGIRHSSFVIRHSSFASAGPSQRELNLPLAGGAGRECCAARLCQISTIGPQFLLSSLHDQRPVLVEALDPKLVRDTLARVNRRHFSRLLATGGGSAGLWQARIQAADPQKTDRREPVNVADFQAWAKETLPPATYDYITTGSADEITLRENVLAFQRLRILPPLLTGVAEADTTTTVLKERIALPILLAPVAGQTMFHPQGVLAAARAAATAKTIMGVSGSCGNSVEEVAAASAGPKWFQLYVPKDRAIARRLVERADRAGYKAIIVTVDLGEQKDADRRNRFKVPATFLRKHLVNLGFAITEQMTDAELETLNASAWDLALSWDFFDWLRSITKLPLLIKGVLRADDAQKAVSIGLDGIIVSNHGGRRLDGVPASIEQLPQIAQAVNGKAEIYLDSGVRRGTDVLKAIALGAKAVLIGRPYAWALAADGEAGVAKVLDLLREELALAMLATGCANVGSINRSLLAPKESQ